MRIHVIASIMLVVCIAVWLGGCGGGLQEPVEPGAPLSVSVAPNVFDAPGGTTTVTYANTVPVHSAGLVVRDESGGRCGR